MMITHKATYNKFEYGFKLPLLYFTSVKTKAEANYSIVIWNNANLFHSSNVLIHS